MKETIFRFAHFCFRKAGWKVVGTPVPVDQCIVIAAFHTSNLDFWLCLGIRQLVTQNVFWLAKHTIFFGPLGPILRALGGIAVDRSKKTGHVDSARELFRIYPRCVLTLAPEGTRRRQEQWKSGFYQIALATGVPIQPMAFHYRSRALVFGEIFHPSGDIAQDTQKLRAFYASSTPKKPALAAFDFTLSPTKSKPLGR